MKKPNKIKLLARQTVLAKHQNRPTHQPKQKIKPAFTVITPRRFRRTKVSTIIPVQTQSSSRTLLIQKYLPENLKYLTSSKNSPLYLKDIRKSRYSIPNGEILVPRVFSVFENPNESYLMLRKLIFALLFQSHNVNLDYRNCIKVDLASQVLLDVIFKECGDFISKLRHIDGGKAQQLFATAMGGHHIENENVKKLLFSVGSPANIANKTVNFPGTIKCPLCIHNCNGSKNIQKLKEQKDIDTTELADYVISCLSSMNKELTPDKRDDLCTVIGETLINAEEHSTTGYRYSVGYFEETNEQDKHCGIFRLVILNFGRTIYEKFKSDDCPNKHFVEQMKTLSKSYNSRNLFLQKEFEEETLWTLYALQEGVTSVPPDQYHQRGNGSIRFIESFFNIKGENGCDNVSYLRIVSGRTRIIFDGAYQISTKTNQNGEVFRVMTFNKEENLDYKPDKKYVYYADDYFPGTIISAKILLNDDDIKQIN